MCRTFIFSILILCLINLLEAKLNPNYLTFDSLVEEHLIRDSSKSMMAIMFQNKNCQTCDAFEEQLQQIHADFGKQKIHMFRCDVSNKDLSDKFQIKRFPVVHFLYERPGFHDVGLEEVEIYKTTQLLTGFEIIETAKYLRKTLNFLQNNKHNSPFIQTLQEIPKGNKMVVNMEKMQNLYNFDQKDFLQKLLLDDSFNSMPIVPLTSELFEFFIISNNFQNAIKNSKTQVILLIVLEQDENESDLVKSVEKKRFDKLVSLNLDFKQIFKSFLFHSVQQFTENLYIFQQDIYSILNPNVPIYLAIVDTIWERDVSRKYTMMLNQVLNIFENEVVIFWMEGEINPEKKILLGFNKNTKPPMFGRLVLDKKQPKQPLKGKIKDEPIFSLIEIKSQLRKDLGYQKYLPQTLNSTLQQLGMGKSIQLEAKVQFESDSKRIEFVFCTSTYIEKEKFYNLDFLISRFKRFYPNSGIKIITQPCFINQKSVQDGLYMATFQQTRFIHPQISSCRQIQPKIQQISHDFAKKLNRTKLIPQNFCVLQKQMRNFLSNPTL